MSTEEKYVAAAYLVIFAVVLAYVVIIAASANTQRMARVREAPRRSILPTTGSSR